MSQRHDAHGNRGTRDGPEKDGMHDAHALPTVARGAFQLLLRLLPRQDRPAVSSRVLEGLEEGWSERRRHRGRRAALAYLGREWMDLTWNVVADRRRGSRTGHCGDGSEGGGSVEGIWFDVRTATRGLRRSPALVVGTVLTLGIGIGANLALFSVLHGVLLQPLPFGQPQELVALHTEWDGSRELGLTWREIERLDDEAMSLESVAGTLLPGMDTRFVLERADGREVVEALRVSPNFFRVLDVRPQLGHGVQASEPLAEVEPSVLLSDATWRRRWGADPDVVGRRIRITDVGYRVAGVLPPGFSFHVGSRAPELYLVQTPSGPEQADLSNPIVLPVARLAPGVDVDGAGAELARMAPELEAARPLDAPDVDLGIRTLRERLVGDLSRPLASLGWAATLVLIVACANLAALFLARHTERESDQALRAALGAGRERLARLPLVEAVLLGLAGGVLGLGLAAFSTDLVIARMPDPLFGFDGFELGLPLGLGAVALSVVAGLLFGALPAWRSARIRPAEALGRSGSRGGRTGSRATRLLAGAEAAALVVLLVATGLSLRSLDALVHVDLGFESEERVVATLILPPGVTRRRPSES